MKIFKQIIKYVFLGLIFGTIYYHIEVLAVGYSSIYMFFVGAIAALCCGLINEILDWETAFLSQMVISAVVITIIEFISGIILNIWLGLNLWNYDGRDGCILGQVCYQNTIYWFILSPIALILDDFIRWKFFDEEKPHYRWI